MEKNTKQQNNKFSPLGLGFTRLVFGLSLLMFLAYGQASAQNNALNFVPTGFPNEDYVSIPYNSNLDITSNLTLSAWIKPNGTSSFDNILLKGNYGYGFAIDDNNKLGYWSDPDYVNCPNFGTITDNVWTHVAVVVVQGVSTTFYINGVQVGQSTFVGHTTINTGGANAITTIGRQGDLEGNYFGGDMDEVMVWNTALNVTQINTAMNMGFSGSEAGLVAYYKFNQGVANATNTGITTLTDVAGGDNNGTLTNFALTGTTSNWVGGQPASPGGVSNNLRLWLRADAGVTTATGVSQWNDQSPNGLNATQATGANQPTFSANGLNFNPTLLFNGTSHRLSTASTSLFSSNSSPVSFFTVFNTSNNSGQRFLVNQRFNNNCVTNIQLGYTTGFGGVGNYGLHTGCGNAAVAPDGTIPNNTYQMMSTLILNTGTTPANINIFRNGASVGVANNGSGYTSAGSYNTSTQNVPIEIGVRNDAYLGSSYNGYHVGNIGEIIIYTSTPTATERRQVESYLALKYGLTIDQSTATDYLASNGTTEMWDKDLAGASTYRNNIAGIGRDDASALNQKQSRSINANTPLTIGLGTVATTNALNTNTFANDRRFLTWADNNTALASVSTTDVPNASFPRRMARIWQAQEPNGDVGNTQVVLDITGIGLTGASASNFVLLLDSDVTFANGVTNSIVASSLVGSIVTFNNVNFTNGQYFTFANFTGGAPSGVRGNMIDLNGSNQSIEVANSTNLNSYTTTGEITIEYWAYSKDLTTIQDIIAKRPASNNGGFVIETNSGTTTHFINTNTGWRSVNITYDLNQWVHIAMVAKASTGELIIYKNGVPTGTSLSGAFTSLTVTSAVLRIGRDSETTNVRFYNGNLDEVRIWNTARTQAQIRENMHLTLSGIESGLVAYYQFNETSGNAIDAIGGNNGVLQNTPTRPTSTLSVGKGVSKTVSVTSVGAGAEVSLATTNMEIDFSASSANPNGNIVVSQITAETPNQNTTAPNATTSCYWVVRNFGTNTGLAFDNMRFQIPSSNRILLADETLPTNLRLYRRNINGGATWTQIADANSASNTTKLINFDAPSNTSFSEFIIGSTSGALPITLLGLKGERVTSGQDNRFTEEVKLTWTTAQEINNKGFEVEMSEDGLAYQKIAFVEGVGSSNTPKHYTLNTINPNDAYYRLRQVDFDGKFSYSPVVFVEGVDALKVYPNPNNGAFTISVGKETFDSPARLLNAQGKEVWRGTQTKVRTTGLPTGTYFLHTTVAGKTKVTKVVIYH